MDKSFKEPSRRAQQKAIDGILFGPTPTAQPHHPSTPMPRNRFRGMHDVAPPQQAAVAGRMQPTPRQTATPARPQLSQRSAAPLTPQSTFSAVDETIDESVLHSLDPTISDDSKKRKKAKKGPRFPFLRHPIKTFKSWSWKKRVLCIFIILVIIGALIGGFLFLKGFTDI